MQNRELEQNNDSDFELMLFVFNPILIHLLTKKIINEIEISELVNKCENLLIKYSLNFNNKKLHTELIHILKQFPTNEIESNELYDYVSELDQEIFRNIQIPSYLICSIYKNSKEAIKMHFIIAQTFQLYEGSISYLVLNPFLREFWQKRIKDNPTDFRNFAKFYENLQKTKKLKISLQTLAIFALAAENLNYNLNDKDKLWLKKYTDKYGE